MRNGRISSHAQVASAVLSACSFSIDAHGANPLNLRGSHYNTGERLEDPAISATRRCCGNIFIPNLLKDSFSGIRGGHVNEEEI